MHRNRIFLGIALGTIAVGLCVGALWAKARLALPLAERLARASKAKKKLLTSLGLKKQPKHCSIVIHKSARRLVLYGDGIPMLVCLCALGGAPEGDKVQEGDQKTPEGDFYVCTRNDRSKFHLFLGVSYPKGKDAKRGLLGDLISKQQHDAIVIAESKRRRPPWNTTLGGAIGIHGYGTTWDWTLGCIALSNKDIETLWGFCPIGTPIKILP